MLTSDSNSFTLYRYGPVRVKGSKPPQWKLDDQGHKVIERKIMGYAGRLDAAFRLYVDAYIKNCEEDLPEAVMTALGDIERHADRIERLVKAK